MMNGIVKTDSGWVNLSNLVYSNNYVNWDKSIGKTVDFQYDDIIATLTITERDYNVQYVYIDVPGYVEHFRIYVGQIRNGQLGNVVKKITPDFKYEIGDVVNNLLITGKYRTSRRKHYNYCCVKDGHIGTIREDHLSHGHGCPVCSNSIGEKNVANYLTKHNIAFLQQHPFDGCIYRDQLYFDFYLPNLNVCIEYDGIQHFEPVDFAGKGEEWAKEHFNYTMLRDEVKNNYCKNNNIPLCRIKYTQDVEKTLNDFFNTLSNNTIQN